MPVNTPHRDYKDMAARWRRCRDTYSGGDAVKAGGTLYLPKLDSHKDNNDTEGFEAYQTRALFFNAFKRTVQGFSGGIYMKPPEVKVPPRIQDDLPAIDLADTPFASLAEDVTTEVLTVGRGGILVEMSMSKSSSNRPYWTVWREKDIVNWRTTRRGGDEILTRVILREFVEVEDPEDPFKADLREQYRVLELKAPEGGGVDRYVQQVWIKVEETGEWQQDGPDIVPMRRGEAMSFIPFVFLGPTNNFADVAVPPLLDLVDVNLSHFRDSADLQHGLHYTGMPVLVLIDPVIDEATGKIKYGSSEALLINPGGDAKLLQADGDALGALQNSMADKKTMMTVLGARLLEDQPRANETATAVSMRHAGEHATLRSIAGSIERGLEFALRCHAWWSGNEALPADVKGVTVELNKDFLDIKAPPEMVDRALNMLMAGEIPRRDFYHVLETGEWLRPGIAFEQRLAEIRAEGGTGGDDGGE